MPDKKFGDTWGGQLGMSMAQNTANGLLGQVFGQFTAKRDDKRQLKQAGKLQALQIQGNKEMLDYQKMKDLEMWKATSYPGQLEMLEQAGLNPALMYGQSGGGGVTTGGTASVQGQIAGARSEGIQGMGMMMQNAMTAAQTELIKAQTEKTKAETTKTAGVDTTLGETTIEKLKQETSNAKVKQLLDRTELALNNLQLSLNENTFDYKIEQERYNLSKTMEEFNELAFKNEITQETLGYLKEQVVNATIASRLHNEALRAGINLNKAQIEKIAADISAQLKELSQTDRQLSQQDQKVLIEKERNRLIETGIWVGAASNIIGEAVDIFTKKRR